MYNFNFFTMKHNQASKILITFLVLFQFSLNGQELEKTLPEEVGVSS